jgi:hypothetical protein
MSEGQGNAGASAGGIGLVTVILALIFLFVWPGPLRYEYRGDRADIKIDRISHKVWVYNPAKGLAPGGDRWELRR